MKAIVYSNYGAPDVLQLQEVEKPTPKANEILIRIHATPVNFGDIIARKFNRISPREFSMPLLFWCFARLAMGVNKPKNHTLGSEFAGVVEAVGKDVTRFRQGDPVFGYRSMNFGANAEYLSMPADGLVEIKPSNMTYSEAAAVPYGALTALSLLRKAGIQSGQKVLINGASGAIGSYALQIAKILGAEVTGVCSTPGVELVKALGADRVVDYTKEDFTRSGETYDLIVDVLGKSSFSRCKNVLKPDGRYLLVSFKMRQLLQMLWTSITGGKKVICALSSEKLEDLSEIKAWIEAGRLKSVIDKSYSLEQTADAHRYVESGAKKGHVIIAVA